MVSKTMSDAHVNDGDFQDAIAPLTVGNVTIGYVEQIHGKGAEMVEEQITRSEVETIVTKYLTKICKIDAEWKFLGSTGSYESRMSSYSWKRVNEFVCAGAIEESRVKELHERLKPPIDESFAELSKKL